MTINQNIITPIFAVLGVTLAFAALILNYETEKS